MSESGAIGSPSVGSGAEQAGDLDELLRQVLARVHDVVDERERLALLLDAVVTMAADLSWDGVLGRLVEIASRLVDARYAALGVVNPAVPGRLQTFVHHGVTSAQEAQIGDLPTGHGLLGLIIDRPEPLRLHDIAEHPASYGFPEHHPPMHSFLGVPVRTRGQVFGNLYLTEKSGGGDFTERDQEVVIALAAAAGVVIENARLYQESARRQRWLAATADITAVLSRPSGEDDPLQIVADRAREVAEADVAWVSVGSAPELLELRVVSGVKLPAGDLSAISLTDSISAQVVSTGAPVSIPDVAAMPSAYTLASALNWPQLGPVIAVPLSSADGTEGVLALGWTPTRGDAYLASDASLPASFAEQATLALQVARAREDQQLLAVFEDRDRIGRDLHDLVIQRIFAVGLGLQSLARNIDAPEARARLEQAADDLDATIQDIRRSIFALGSMQTNADLQTEVTSLVDRAAATLKFRPTLRFDGPVRTLIDPDVAPDLLAVLGEALSNVSRHAHAASVSVRICALTAVEDGDHTGARAVLEVSDDGRGLPDQVAESGLANIRRRAEQRGGELAIHSSPETGTRLIWSVPAQP